MFQEQMACVQLYMSELALGIISVQGIKEIRSTTNLNRAKGLRQIVFMYLLAIVCVCIYVESEYILPLGIHSI